MDLINYLKGSCLIQDPNITKDTLFLKKSDEDIKLVLQICANRLGTNLESIEEENIYLLLLLAKKELFMELALSSAPLYSIKTETVSIEKNQRFEHYTKLISILDREIKTYQETNTKINVGEVLLSKNYFSTRNYNNSRTPKIHLKVDNIEKDSIDVSWMLTMEHKSKFNNYTMYISRNPILDEYNIDNPIKESDKIAIISDIHVNKYRIENLVPNKEYYILIVVSELNGLKGYSETSVITKGE